MSHLLQKCTREEGVCEKLPVQEEAQERPIVPPSQPNPAMLESVKPKADINNLQKSQPRNEPLDISEVLVLGLSGLPLRPGKLNYRVDAFGFIVLFRATYAEYNALDRYFERTITPAMFEYYCISAYWKLVYQLMFDAGKDIHRTYRQLESVVPLGLVMPGPIALWLARMGGFTDPSGKQFE